VVQRERILVVEDEASIRYFLTETLLGADYEVVAVDSGEAALARIVGESFDLALLDLHLPGIGGMAVLAALREQSPETAVIVLTAHASLETAVTALRQGAHDYLFKPCEPEQLRESVRTGLLKRQRELRHREVLARLEQVVTRNLEDILASALERAIMPQPTAAREPDTPRLSHGPLALDGVRRVALFGEHVLDLSVMEFDLLLYLAHSVPRPVSSQELAREVLHYQGEPWELNDLMRSHIYRIRQKIKAANGDPMFIRTVRGTGYTLGEVSV
jgi:DNA-binding response OmpR family regulator